MTSIFIAYAFRSDVAPTICDAAATLKQRGIDVRLPRAEDVGSGLLRDGIILPELASGDVRVIVDISVPNLNAYFELGMARGLGIPALCVCHASRRPTGVLRDQERYVPYRNVDDLVRIALRWSIEPSRAMPRGADKRSLEWTLLVPDLALFESPIRQVGEAVERAGHRFRPVRPRDARPWAFAQLDTVEAVAGVICVIHADAQSTAQAEFERANVEHAHLLGFSVGRATACGDLPRALVLRQRSAPSFADVSDLVEDYETLTELPAIVERRLGRRCHGDFDATRGDSPCTFRSALDVWRLATESGRSLDAVAAEVLGPAGRPSPGEGSGQEEPWTALIERCREEHRDALLHSLLERSP